MIRTLIVLLASAALTLPAAAQQTGGGQGAGQKPGAVSGENAGGGAGKGMNGGKSAARQGGGQSHEMRAGRGGATERVYGGNRRGGERLARGRAGYLEYDRGVRLHGDRMRRYSGVGCSYYYEGGRRVYYGDCRRGPRYGYNRRPGLTYREYGSIAEGGYRQGGVALRENRRGGERARHGSMGTAGNRASAAQGGNRLGIRQARKAGSSQPQPGGGAQRGGGASPQEGQRATR